MKSSLCTVYQNISSFHFNVFIFIWLIFTHEKKILTSGFVEINRKRRRTDGQLVKTLVAMMEDQINRHKRGSCGLPQSVSHSDKSRGKKGNRYKKDNSLKETEGWSVYVHYLLISVNLCELLFLLVPLLVVVLVLTGGPLHISLWFKTTHASIFNTSVTWILVFQRFHHQ